MVKQTPQWGLASEEQKQGKWHFYVDGLTLCGKFSGPYVQFLPALGKQAPNPDGFIGICSECQVEQVRQHEANRPSVSDRMDAYFNRNDWSSLS